MNNNHASIIFCLKELLSLNKMYWTYIFSGWWKRCVKLLSLFCTVLSLFAIFDVKNTSVIIIILTVVICILSFLLSIPRHYKKIKINNLNNTYVEIIIGDMFNEKCDMIISTNTCFDTSPECIKDDSLQGLFCKKIYNSDYSLLSDNVQCELRKLGTHTEQLDKKNIGNNIQYPINTIITISNGSSAEVQRFHWIAINHSNNVTGVIEESVDIYKSVISVWEYLYCQGIRRDLCFPMIGTGYAGQQIGNSDLAEFIIDSFIFYSQKRAITNTLKLYLYPKNISIFEDFCIIVNYLKYRSQHHINIAKKYNLSKGDIKY